MAYTEAWPEEVQDDSMLEGRCGRSRILAWSFDVRGGGALRSALDFDDVLPMYGTFTVAWRSQGGRGGRPAFAYLSDNSPNREQSMAGLVRVLET